VRSGAAFIVVLKRRSAGASAGIVVSVHAAGKAWWRSPAVNVPDSFPDFFGRKERAVYRIARQPNQMEQALLAAPQSRIAPVDRIGILQCTKPYVHNAKPLDYRVFEIIAAAGLVMWRFVLIYRAKFNRRLLRRNLITILETCPMTEFDYNASAELYSTRRRMPRRQPLGYRRFAQAADAIRFAIEDLEPELLVGAYLEVGEERFDSGGIRQLYDSAEYPLARRVVHS
jgi:hypothetical protein